MGIITMAINIESIRIEARIQGYPIIICKTINVTKILKAIHCDPIFRLEST